MSFCSNCGKKFEQSDLFCQNCGFSLEELHENHSQTGLNGTFTTKRQPSILVGLGVLLLLGGGSYYAWQYFYPSRSQVVIEHASQSDKDKSETSTSDSSVESGAKVKTSIVSETAAVSHSEESSASNEISESSSLSATIIKSRNESGTVVTSMDAATTSSSSDEKKLLETTFSTSGIEQLFGNQFNNVAGNHALYFQDITNEKGEEVTSVPLIINDRPIRSASTIKLFVLAALFNRAEQGGISLETVHHLSVSDIVGGTGVIQNSSVGTPFTLRALATEMIISSDNTAMNIIVDYLGFDTVNQYIREQGYTQTVLNRKMLDSAALSQGKDNYISAKEAGDLMRRIYTKTLISPSADEQLLSILSMQKDKTNLEANLPVGITTYNKTGQYADYGIRNDISIVSTAKGTYVLVVLSQDGKEQQQIAAMQAFGHNVYQTFINQ
ncbi:serine hydrolase [Aerococcaceae bacterium NML190938]|nr:serine hydrolase [Aerococcaceae bacterium NML190938]